MLPTLSEQRKIAAILSSVDAAIEKTQAIIEQLQVIKKGMMQDLLTRGIPGRHCHYKTTPIGEVPEEWKVLSLSDLAIFITSGSRGWAQYYSKAGTLFLRSQNIRAGFIDLTEKVFVNPPKGAEGERTVVKPNDILITITGNSIGNVAYASSDIGDAYVSQHVGLVRLRQLKLSQYITIYLSPGAPGNDQIIATQYGQSKPGLSLNNLRSFLIAIPDEYEMLSITEKITSIQTRITIEQARCDCLRTLKSDLLTSLLTGEIRVTPDPEPESAKEDSP